MAFYITKNKDQNTILTNGGSIKVGANLSIDEEGYLNATGGGGGSQIQADWDLNNPAADDYIKNKPIIPSGGGNLDNIRINNILGEVTDKISELTLTGADIKITGYEESLDVNENLELDASDTVNGAFGKLAKALKDDEAAVTRAFLQVESSTGFNDNLEYVPEDLSSILGNATNLLLADNILMLHIGDIETDIQTIRNATLTFTKGASGTFNTLTTGSKIVTIPWGGNTTNLMKDYPPENGNYYADIQTVLSASEVLPLLSGGDLFPGRCITFATGPDSSVAGRDIWKTYQYVGPLEDDTVSYTHYTNINYWKEVV